MASLSDYLTWRGDITFDQVPLTTVDALLLSQLSYLDLRKIMSGGLKFDIFSSSTIVYDGSKGFIFTNINHKLSKFKTENEFNKCFIRNCLSLCSANFEFSENISDAIKNQLKDFNKVIFEKCTTSLCKQGISANLVSEHSTNIWKN